MNTVPVTDDLELAARYLRYYAELYRPCDGHGMPAYRLLHHDSRSGIIMAAIYSRDTGHHTSGWFKNPDYERCYHLSLSYWYMELGRARALTNDKPTTATLTGLVFGDWRRYVWIESAKSDGGKAIGVTHYRVFCDPAWVPIVPRGEVYARDFTEKGWQSWSQQHPDQPGASHLQHEHPDR